MVPLILHSVSHQLQYGRLVGRFGIPDQEEYLRMFLLFHSDLGREMVDSWLAAEYFPQRYIGKITHCVGPDLFRQPYTIAAAAAGE